MLSLHWADLLCTGFALEQYNMVPRLSQLGSLRHYRSREECLLISYVKAEIERILLFSFPTPSSSLVDLLANPAISAPFVIFFL